MTRLRLTTLLLGALALAGLQHRALAATPPEAICSASTTVFCAGFEEGNLSVWDDYDGNPAPWNTIISDPGAVNRSDNHATLMRVPAGRGGTDLVKVLPQSYDKLYVRWYQKWETGYSWNVGTHGGGLHAGDRSWMGHSDTRPTGSDWFSAWLEPMNGRLNMYVYYRGMYMDCGDPNGACWGDHFPCWLDEGTGYCKKAAHREHTMPPLMETNRWYCLEFMVDAGSPVTSDAAANGAMDMWIDGTQYGPWNNLWFRTTANLKLNILWPGIFHHSEHSTQGTMFDNIVVSTQRIGCLASGKTPNPPTNVAVPN